MQILKIEIDSFGKLREFSLEPGRGITVIEGENESGKSTLLAFLRFVLYGFPRKNAPDGDERDKRISWQTRTAAGRLTLAWKGDVYRITRRFLCRSTAARESVSEELSVVRVSDGQEVALEGKTPGEHFLGLPPELYDGSLSLVQSGADRVCAVTLQVGEMTEAIPDALHFAFEALSEGTMCEGAQLEVDMIGPRSLCLECGEEFDHDRFHRKCPVCESYETTLISGRELEIASIEVEFDDE